MATKASAPPAKRAAKKTAKKTARKTAPKAAAPKAAPAAKAYAGFNPQMMSGMDLSKMAKMMTPEQAIELYKANAKLALDVINAAIEHDQAAPPAIRRRGRSPRDGPQGREAGG